MDPELKLKSGYMSVFHKGILGKQNWNDKWCILVARSSKSPAYLQKYDSPEETKHSKSLDLHKLLKVQEYKESRFIFEIVIKSESHFFRCKDENDRASWIQAFQQILQSGDRSSKASTVSGELIVENNILYQSVEIDYPLFKVQVNENEDSKRFGLQTETDYYLAVYPNNIDLQDSEKKKSLISWPYQQIKSFGRLQDMFQINSGRRTCTGPGEFSFQTTESDLISDSISKMTKTSRKFDSNESINTANVSPQLARNEQPKLLNSSYLSKSVTVEVGKASLESKEEKSHLSKSVSDETSKLLLVDDSLKQNIEKNLKQGLVKQQSVGEEPARTVFKGDTESQICTKSLKNEKKLIEKKKKEEQKEKEKRAIEEAKKQKEEQKEKEKKAKEEAKKEEKERKAEEKRKKKNKGLNSRPVSEAPGSHLYDDSTNTYEEVDDVRRSSLNEAGAYSLPRDNIPAPKRAIENHYAEPDNLQGKREGAEKTNMYSTAEQERCEAWREFGTENLHEEDYANIRSAAINPNIAEGDYDMPEEVITPSNAQPIPSDSDDETYDHISSFDFQLRKSKTRSVSRPESVDTENVYGDNSGVKINANSLSTRSSGYEEASIVTVKSLKK